MKWLQLTYKSLTIIIVMHIGLVVTGCSNTSQPNKQDSIKLSEVVGDKITIQICGKVISVPKKPITMIQSFLYRNPPGYQSVQVSLVPVDKVSIIFKVSDFYHMSYDVFSPLATAEIYCDGYLNDDFYSIRNLKLIKVIDLTDLGLSQYKVEKPRSNIEYAYFFPINAVKPSDGFDLRCEPSDLNKNDFRVCFITGFPKEGVGLRIRFNDIRDWREYKEVFESLISIERNDGKSH